MCSEYEVYAELAKIDETLGFTVRKPKVRLERFDLHVRIYSQAPIIQMTKGEFAFEMANFSLLPPPPRFSTFNARLSDWDKRKDCEITIYDKTTWKKPFTSTRCLIPMTAFLEPIYLGDRAGTVQRFSSPKDQILFAPGIWQESPNPKSPGELYVGFSMIIHTPLDFVLKTGHHRSPVLLAPEHAQTYLADSMTAEERYEFLLENRHVPKLEATEQRTMAKGWEKRVKENAGAHEEEMEFVRKFTASRDH